LRAQQIAKHPEDVARAAETLRKARFSSKKQFEQRFIKRLSRTIYEPGELVLVRNTPVEMSLDRKKEQRYLGPYEIALRTSWNNYYINELDGTRIKGNKAAFRILPYISRDHWFMKEGIQEESSESDSGNESEESD